MATVRNRYVDTDAAGGNGQSWATAYSSLNAAEQAEDDTGNLTTTDEYVVFHCRASSGTADTTAVLIDGWETDATRYVRVQCDSSDRHGGIYTTAKYRLEGATSYWGVLGINEDYVQLEGLQCGGTSIGGGGTATVRCDALYLLCNSCIYRGVVGCSDENVFICASGAKIFNTISISSASSSQGAIFSLGTSSIYSCTVAGTFVSYYATLTIKNCYAKTYLVYGDSPSLTTCASSDTTGSIGLQNIAYSTSSGAYFTNVTAGSEDLRIASASSALVNAGTDTSGESAPLNFTVDIAGTTRS